MFWKIYSSLLTLVSLPAYSNLMRYSPTIFDHLDMIICIGALMGFVGFSFRFRIISAQLWKVYFFLDICWDLFYNIFITMILHRSAQLPDEVNLGWKGALLSFAIVFPQYIGLYKYGFKSDQLWDGEDAIDREGQRHDQ